MISYFNFFFFFEVEAQLALRLLGQVILLPQPP